MKPTTVEPPEVGARRTLTGVVVGGDRLGRELGYPTANLLIGWGPDFPTFGIYVGRCLDRPAAVSIGVRPTFGERLEPRVEVHIVGFDGDLYGQSITVELLEYLRPEQRFDAVGSLVEQIAADVRAVRLAYLRHVRAELGQRQRSG